MYKLFVIKRTFSVDLTIIMIKLMIFYNGEFNFSSIIVYQKSIVLLHP